MFEFDPACPVQETTILWALEQLDPSTSLKSFDATWCDVTDLVSHAFRRNDGNFYNSTYSVCNFLGGNLCGLGGYYAVLKEEHGAERIPNILERPTSFVNYLMAEVLTALLEGCPEPDDDEFYLRHYKYLLQLKEAIESNE